MSKDFSISLQRWYTALSVALLALLAAVVYLPLIGQLGLYLEDWYVIWSGSTNGPASLIPLYAFDRPLEGYLYATIYPLLGENVLGWHLYAFAIRLLSGLLFFWLLRILWPGQRFETMAASVLFVIYPGFTQQVQAVSFQVHLTALVLALFSLILTVLAVKNFNIWATIFLHAFAVLLMPIYPLLMEYYLGLEAVRLVLIWLAVRQRQPLSLLESFLDTLKNWWPYFLALLGYLYWRVFLFAGGRPTTSVGRLVGEYAGNLSHMLVSVVVEWGKDLLEVIYMAWSVPLENFFYWGSYTDLLIAGIFTLIAVLLFILFAWRMQREDLGPREQLSTKTAWIWIGLLMVVVALIPVVAANRDVQFTLRDDRFSLPASLGAVIFTVGLLSLALRSRLRIWALAFLVGVSALTQLNYAGYMRDFWSVQRDIWWQMSWRAPQLKEGTLLMVRPPDGFNFAEGYESWAPADLIYYPDMSPPPITGEVLYQATLPLIRHGGEAPTTHRGIPLARNFDQLLVASMPTQLSCLNVIDGRKYELPVEEDPIVQLVAPYSRIQQIELQAGFHTPPISIFGPEPQHSWCYFYQKASYARQIGDWKEITRLGDRARELGYSPAQSVEWMPFLEGYASVGRDKDARQLAAIIKSEPGSRNEICRQLAEPPDYPEGYAHQAVIDLLC
ncbi:MAG: hypothetical protein P8074_12805 [Anaerolineales bacterium]|jgi:hypothetical protein